MDILIFDTIDILGTIAFAVSGTLVGIDRRLDLFGVAVLAMITATGGGAIRDLVLGITPVTVLYNPTNALVALFVSLVLFFVYQSVVGKTIIQNLSSHSTYAFIDAAGLGLFMISGMQVAVREVLSENMFLVLCSGVLTAIGGGILRDVLAKKIPQVLNDSYLYATAALLGGGCYIVITWLGSSVSVSMLVSVILIVLIRMVSLSFEIGLPVSKKFDDET